jgi:hypothetical protein
MTNEYDEIKGLLNKVRKIQAMSVLNKEEQLLKEQVTSRPVTGEDDYLKNAGQLNGGVPTNPENSAGMPEEGGEEQQDVAVINDVEIEIHSEDPEDLALQDVEKQKISQLIDDFRKEVSEIAEFDKLHVYSDSAKLDGKIGGIDLGFSLSTGEDTGLYISNPSMLKIDDNSLSVINKLRTFEPKFVNTINDLLVNRRTT